MVESCDAAKIYVRERERERERGTQKGWVQVRAITDCYLVLPRRCYDAHAM